MKNKKSLFVKIGCFCLALAIAIVPFLSLSKSDEVAYADSVDVTYSFHSSDTYYISSFLGGGSLIVPVLFSADNTYLNNQLFINFNMFLSYTGSGYTNVDYYLCDFFQQYKSSSLIKQGNSTDNYYLDFDTIYTFYSRHLSTDSQSVSFKVRADNGFNSNVYRVDLSCSASSVLYPNYTGNNKFFNISYYSLDNKLLSYVFLVPSNFKFSDRTYYLQDPSTLADNQLYNSGYADGYNVGTTDGYSTGYTAGNTAGYDQGYGVGYNTGVVESNDYSFLGLIGAIVDAPIQAFTGLLDFNVLGIDLGSFFLSLFSVACVIAIIKLLKG